MSRIPNPLRSLVLAVGLLLSRFGLVTERRARRITDLSWPRILTGLARMSKSAVDVAMVGIALGPAAIAGVGFASPYWGLAFSLGGGMAAGTIALVSQRYGADAHEELGQAVRSSALVVVAVSLPVALAFLTVPEQLVGIVSDDPVAIGYGADYLRVVAFGVPFAGLNLVASRVYIGADDAWTPMVLRAGGAVANIAINAVLIFGFDMGVVGAATGTVVSNAVVAVAFSGGLVAGRLPGVGDLPVRIDPRGPYLDGEEIRQLVRIGAPVVGRNLVWTVAEFPMLAIVDVFGRDTVAAFVVSRRIWGLMNTPGWGFGLASSSLVGQHLGTDDETTAEAYGREIITFAVATYVISAALVLAFARPIVVAFVGDPTAGSVDPAVALVRAACVAVVLQGVSGGAAGALDASGDTQWPFFSQAVGMFGVSIPLAYLGATTSLGFLGLQLAFLAETGVPAALNYHRFRTGKWKAVSRGYRPDAAVGGD
ncbi:MATE family efflux transporter [Halorarum halophilum]|uniref:Multidrug-efflux transporter n=1 Tax=Halorarum halophilum TaxID=2743090 RepID=A0A7D5KH30_9EURY|nr:MATE family efflux transporter [Halobaculum halophilum]QLG28776.1 MATE family efflux transporter [Halobaculum halophilum]